MSAEDADLVPSPRGRTEVICEKKKGKKNHFPPRVAVLSLYVFMYIRTYVCIYVCVCVCVCVCIYVFICIYTDVLTFPRGFPMLYVYM